MDVSSVNEFSAGGSSEWHFGPHSLDESKSGYKLRHSIGQTIAAERTDNVWYNFVTQAARLFKLQDQILRRTS